MAVRGRKPKSIEAHLRDGSLNATRHATKTPLLIKGRDGRPKVPRWLDSESQRAYGKLMRDLWGSGILDGADDGLVIAAACALGDMWSASLDIRRWGRIVAGNRGRCKNPAIQIRQTAQVEFRQCCSLLGIGPADRARLANLGVKGRSAEQTIPALAKIAQLKAVPGGKKATG